MDRGYKRLSIRHQGRLLEVARSSLYYKPTGESEENLKAMKLMDSYHMEHPSCGVLGMQDILRGEKIMANHKRVKRINEDNEHSRHISEKVFE